MKETRYAVLIGMNDYKKNPLSYSVKDVLDVKNVLIEYCRFDNENIFTIVDSSTPIITQIHQAFEKIKKQFRRNSDLILFYYSGHGEYDSEQTKSLLFFQDETSLGIGDIAKDYFEPLEAKNQYLIIDACHSGKNVYIKQKNNPRKIERKLFYDSKEIYFLFAAEENKKAYQNEKLKNSYFSYYFIEAVKDKKLYDEDGLLSMNSIDEYIRKKISVHKDVIQIPGSESRTTGYKPFAFRNETIKKVEKIPEILKINIMEDSNDFDLGSSLTIENRQRIQNQLKELLTNKFENFILDEDLIKNYDINIKSKYDHISYELEKDLEKNIIKVAKNNNLEVIKGLFSEKLIKNNRKKTGLFGMFDMLHGEPEPEYDYDILYDDNFIIPAFIELKAKSFEIVSGGLYCLLYQAKYGFVFCKTFFKYDWDGTHEKISKFIKIDLTAFRLKDENVYKAEIEIEKSLNQLIENIKKWNQERKDEISAFLKKTN